jgi:hypothetical protein
MKTVAVQRCGTGRVPEDRSALPPRGESRDPPGVAEASRRWARPLARTRTTAAWNEAAQTSTGTCRASTCAAFLVLSTPWANCGDCSGDPAILSETCDTARDAPCMFEAISCVTTLCSSVAAATASIRCARGTWEEQISLRSASFGLVQRVERSRSAGSLIAGGSKADQIISRRYQVAP